MWRGRSQPGGTHRAQVERSRSLPLSLFLSLARPPSLPLSLPLFLSPSLHLSLSPSSVSPSVFLALSSLSFKSETRAGETEYQDWTMERAELVSGEFDTLDADGMWNELVEVMQPALSRCSLCLSISLFVSVFLCSSSL